MPWTVRVEDERGRPHGESFVVVEFGSLPKGAQFPISTLIEAAPYYDTVLNPIQANALIGELSLATAEFGSTPLTSARACESSFGTAHVPSF